MVPVRDAPEGRDRTTTPSARPQHQIYSSAAEAEAHLNEIGQRIVPVWRLACAGGGPRSPTVRNDRSRS